MSVCSICRFQIVDSTTTICPNCGAPVRSHADDNEYEPADDQVSHGESTDYTPQSNTPQIQDEDSIQICDPGDLLYSQNQTEPVSSDQEEEGLIGDSAPPPPSEEKSSEDEDGETNGSIQKLSEEQIKNIRSDMLSRDDEDDDYVSPNDAAAIMSGLTHGLPKDKPADNGFEQTNKIPTVPATSPESDSTPSPTADEETKESAITQSPPVRRVAYFHKNFIQLTGPFNPAMGDELIIGERFYLLKPKKIKSQYTIAAFAAVMVIVLFLIGKQFVSPTMPGQGSIIGVILDENDQPYINGAEIRIPDNGKKVVSDPLGFFRFESLPPGIYKMVYTLSNGTTMSENISVVDGEITTLTLGGTEDYDFTEEEPAPVRQKAYAKGTDNPNPPPANQASSSANKSEPKATKAEKQYSALKLKANVSEAKLTVNGQVLGVGNLTYKKLGPGTHTVEVSKSGYVTWKGKVKLSENETYALRVALEPVTTTNATTNKPEEPTYTAEDFFQSGKTMLADGNSSAAISDFTEAITMSPSMADAYALRAEAYIMAGKNEQAVMDYVRSGEIHTNQKRLESGLKMFNKALDIDDKSVAALLNVGDYYRRKGDRDEALRYYKNVLRYDKSNFRASLESGKLYFAMGKNRDADKRLRDAKDANPNDPQVYHYLMLNYFARDDFSRVKETFAEFKANTTSQDVDSYKSNIKNDAILRIVGEYERP